MNVIVWFLKTGIIITDETNSNNKVLKDMIDIRGGTKKCASLSMNDENDINDKIWLNWTECIFNFNIYIFKCLFVRNKDIIY